MGKRKNEKVILEDVELKPQVIGYTYKKKSNFGRVVFIFLILFLVVFYINDISLFINNLLGKESPSSIEELANKNKEKRDNKLVYNVFSNDLIINFESIKLHNFNFNNNLLTFDITNINNKIISFSNRNFFIELYDKNKTLLGRYKLNLNELNANEKISFEYEMKDNFYYISLVEKEMVIPLKKESNIVKK